ncbi:MAG: hypothetical protein R3324_19600, partial [Halobacteriales archaeon]|nr:hypothetical protein [Halobacteriales archaeon]
MANEVEIVTVEVPRPRYPFVPETIPTDEPVSVHFVVGEEVLLFGTGYASGAFELIRAIDRIGGLDVVIVEHGDPDHYDSVPILKELYDDLSVAVPADDAGVLESNGIEADVLLE